MPTSAEHESRHWLLVAAAAALLGGAGALGAEVIFTRRLALIFGVTATAAATVVAVYLAGMALGAAVGGRLADRAGRHAVRLYVAAELLAGLWAVCFPLLFDLLGEGSGSFAGQRATPSRVLLTIVLVGPAAVASGATFPALARVLGDDRQIRILYSVNAGGAALGGLAAGLWLPPLIGLNGTLWLSAGLSALAGALVWCMGQWRSPVVAPYIAPPLAAPVSGREGLLAYAVLGGLGMGSEIGWTRLLEQTGPNPGSLCFPVVLSAYLSGLVLGGILAGRVRRERHALGYCTLVAGAVTVLVMALMPLVPEERLLGHLVGEGPGNVIIFNLTGLQVSADRLLLYLLAVFVPGTASGIGFPLAASAMARDAAGIGRGVGRTAAVGISAAVAVSLWMGFLPSVGPGVVQLMVLQGLLALAAAAAILRSGRLLLLPLLGAAAMWLPPWAGLQIPPGETVRAFVETAAGPSAVTQGADVPHIYTHGERVGGLHLDLEFPMAMHPDPAQVLVIAFGTGINVRGLSRDPSIRSLTCVDIDPSLPSLSAHIPQTGGDLFDGERVHFVHADGRHYLQQSRAARWDIIYSDVATYAQYVELGTTEFFELVRSRLAPGGIFTLKLHPDTLTEAGLWRFLSTFLSVFPDAAMFAKGNPVPVLVGFTEGAPPLPVLEARASASAILYGPNPADAVLRNLQLGPAGLSRLASGRVSTDDRPLSLRHALVGPLTERAVSRAALPALVAACRQHGDRASVEVFGVTIRRQPWEPRSLPLRPRRAWFAVEDPRAPLLQPPRPH